VIAAERFELRSLPYSICISFNQRLIHFPCCERPFMYAKIELLGVFFLLLTQKQVSLTQVSYFYDFFHCGNCNSDCVLVVIVLRYVLLTQLYSWMCIVYSVHIVLPSLNVRKTGWRWHRWHHSQTCFLNSMTHSHTHCHTLQ